MIAVFGGAFNPPTVAHKAICEHVMHHLDCQEFIFLPVSSQYTKRSLASNFHRLQMLTAMIKGMPKVSVSAMELDDPDYLGTYQSLVRISESHPGRKVVFVIGADNLPKFHKWINANGLVSEFRFVVINRDRLDLAAIIDADPFLSAHKEAFIVLPDFDSPVASTIFRETFDPALVTPEVLDYVKTHQLYR
ncbi:MAG TPA: nicotinate (nicotinamide) nucleotide adenylyltransferase [Acholeplasmatales bacterium]|nr:nicotinate (nicotinamide) nucleotide adenylyltransferase [Acholeplasmatales bacterium]